MKQRKTIGRSINSQSTAEDRSSSERTQFFTLKTGRKVKFTFMTIAPQDVEAKTFVRQETNGRDQEALTKASLKDIIKTIKFQQFFACIGVWHDDKIEILDGSRRRASAIFVHTGLDVMVTSENLSAEEARQLAKDIQTAKEHNLREIGLRLLPMKERGLNQKEIAEQEGMSQAKVTRALQAAAVPPELIKLFPVQSELGFSDYKMLIDIHQNLNVKGISLEALTECISANLDEIMANSDLPEEDQKHDILKLISKASQSLIAAPPKEKPVVSPLWEFNEKDKFARKRIKGRTFTYEFCRLPKEVQQELDEAINEVLLKRFSS